MPVTLAQSIQNILIPNLFLLRRNLANKIRSHIERADNHMIRAQADIREILIILNDLGYNTLTPPALHRVGHAKHYP